MPFITAKQVIGNYSRNVGRYDRDALIVLATYRASGNNKESSRYSLSMKLSKDLVNAAGFVAGDLIEFAFDSDDRRGRLRRVERDGHSLTKKAGYFRLAISWKPGMPSCASPQAIADPAVELEEDGIYFSFPAAVSFTENLRAVSEKKQTPPAQKRIRRRFTNGKIEYFDK